MEKTITEMSEKEMQKEKIRRFLFGLILTAITALTTKIMTMLLAHQNVELIIEYFATYHSFWVQMFTVSGLGGFLAQWKINGGKK